MIATLIGGTGLTGSILLRKLLGNPAITKVISVSRRPAGVSDAKLVEVRVSDLAELPRVEPELRGELYFCCLGTTIKAAGSRENFERVDLDAILTFARIARAHDATSFTLVSATGADARSRFFYNRVKGRTEEDVKALSLRSLTIFRPALLVGPRREFRLAECVATNTLVPISRLLSARAGKRLGTDAETLAGRMAAEGKAARPGIHIVEAKDV